MQPWQPLLALWFGDEADDVLRATRQAPSGGEKAVKRMPCWPAALASWQRRQPRAASPTGPILPAVGWR